MVCNADGGGVQRGTKVVTENGGGAKCKEEQGAENEARDGE
ncbi:9664_t:CDS:2 [Paraglomus occultum]|uniref:9664_t:CDS:1 n=1 Tax=Paraglomus occultum TaxID=144539 RepID=A0A9N8ZTY1_9GLOM|nr:9664_t:CDS:2 [Paraglomus occultum]